MVLSCVIQNDLVPVAPVGVSRQEVVYLAFYFPDFGVCILLNLRLHEDGASAAVFKTYVKL